MERILVLGGSNFIGRNLVAQLKERARFEITLFNRGVSNPVIFPDLKHIKGDRNSTDIQLIFDQDWDYIVDLSCYFPNSLAEICSNLKPSLKRYIFISTCSVYDNSQDQSVLRSEDSQILNCSPKQRTDPSPESYGARKSECERILRNSNLQYCIFRPALVYGPFDPTDRLYYWLNLIQRSETLLVPEEGKMNFSLTYVKDLVQMIISALKPKQSSETYNAVSHPLSSIKKLISTASAALDKPLKQYSLNADFLKRNSVSEWTDLPLWLNCNYYTYSNAKVQEELNTQTIEFHKSIVETIEYFKSINWPKPKYGMGDSRKNQLIQKTL